MLVVQPCSKEITAQTKIENTPNIQNVISLNMEQWKVILLLMFSNYILKDYFYTKWGYFTFQILKNIYKLEKPMLNFDNKA